ncbi:MAG: serine hydrolase [Chlorobiota bacterium]|nr:MAG: serine hydrolase [Chlorobiota bacterium]
MKTILIYLLILISINSSLKSQWASKHNMSPNEYQTFFNSSTTSGMRPISISGYTVNGQEKYAALFEKKNGLGWIAKHGMSGADYQSNFTTLSQQGYQVSFISGYEVNGSIKYAAIWEKKSTNYIAKHGLTGAQFQTEFTTNTGNGFRLIFITSYANGNSANYAAIFEKSAGAPYYAHFGLDATTYQQKFNDYSAQGFVVQMVSGCNVNGVDYYSAIWEKVSSNLTSANHGIKGNNYQNVFDNKYYQGYKPVYINAFASSGTEKFNGIWENTNYTNTDLQKINNGVANYMTNQNVKALSLAVCKDGKLVFARGFGDANVSTGQDLSPNHSLRIMSISKSITSTGIMKLVEQGKLNLDQKVFGTGSIFGNKYSYPNTNKTNLETITPRMMLHHTSGLRTCNGEAEFHNSSSTYNDCMTVLLNDSKLFKFTPNTMANYSNTNFFILARIIEQKSGQNYETYLRNNVLTPCGVGNSMYVGANTGNPTSLEVSTYTPMVNMNLKMWDGFGGWVARPIDLLKVLVKFDGNVSKPDLISKALYDTMTTTTVLSNGYALGWIASNTKQTHNGCFPGTRSFLYYDKASGISFAAIVNNDPNEDGCGWDMQSKILDALKTVTQWPSYDLF